MKLTARHRTSRQPNGASDLLNSFQTLNSMYFHVLIYLKNAFKILIRDKLSHYIKTTYTRAFLSLNFCVSEIHLGGWELTMSLSKWQPFETD